MSIIIIFITVAGLIALGVLAYLVYLLEAGAADPDAYRRRPQG